MLVESELPIKVETQVPPIGLGLQRCITCVRGVPEIQAREHLVTSSREVKKLRLVMFESETGPCEKVEENAVLGFQHGHVDAKVAGLGNNRPVVHVRKKSGVQELGRPLLIQLHNRSNIKSRQDGRQT